MSKLLEIKHLPTQVPWPGVLATTQPLTSRCMFRTISPRRSNRPHTQAMTCIGDVSLFKGCCWADIGLEEAWLRGDRGRDRSRFDPLVFPARTQFLPRRACFFFQHGMACSVALQTSWQDYVFFNPALLAELEAAVEARQLRHPLESWEEAHAFLAPCQVPFTELTAPILANADKKKATLWQRASRSICP